MVDEKSFEA
ncbi:hypothetical protein LINPERHAP1_LOCUS21493 [Linum perenne]